MNFPPKKETKKIPLCIARCLVLIVEFDRPGVAEAVLQTALWLITCVTLSDIDSSFVKISAKHQLSKTVRVRDLKLWEIVHPPPTSASQNTHIRAYKLQLLVSLRFNKINN